jgi:hypothetical protein
MLFDGIVMPARGHPRLILSDEVKAWMAGTSPAMTGELVELRQLEAHTTTVAQSVAIL